jgi:hypothetical protein
LTCALVRQILVDLRERLHLNLAILGLRAERAPVGRHQRAAAGRAANSRKQPCNVADSPAANPTTSVVLTSVFLTRNTLIN